MEIGYIIPEPSRACVCVQVVAVNQPFVDVQAVANALKYDSVYGIFDGYVEAYDDVLCINGKYIVYGDEYFRRPLLRNPPAVRSFNVRAGLRTGKRVKVFHEQNPDNLKWDNVPVDYVIDASGKFTDKAKAAVNIVRLTNRDYYQTTATIVPRPEIPSFPRGNTDGPFNISYVLYVRSRPAVFRSRPVFRVTATSCLPVLVRNHPYHPHPKNRSRLPVDLTGVVRTYRNTLRRARKE